MLRYTNKKSIFLSVLLSFISINAMKSPQQTNFKIPSYSLDTLLQSTGVGTSTYFLALQASKVMGKLYPESHVDTKIQLLTALGMGTVGFIATYLYKNYQNSKRSFLDTICSNPLDALNYNYSVRNLFLKETEKLKKLNDFNENFTKYYEILPLFEQRCPIFELGECTLEGRGLCLLSRTHQPKFRKIFEDTVSGALVKKMEDGEEIVYTSFGSGGRFQDLVILTKALKQKPDATIVINLIDMQNNCFVDYCSELKDNRQILLNKNIITLGDIEQFIKLKKNDMGLIVKILAQHERMNKQFLSWLQKMFPQATITFYIHDTVDHYLSHREENNLKYSDIIVTADIQDEGSYSKQGIKNYFSLCATTLERKPDANNYFLAKGINNTVQINTVSLDQIPSSVQETITLNDGATCDLFMQSKEITLNLLQRFASCIGYYGYGSIEDC